MAPNKKKKPTSNPARGFATTSIPAKARKDDERNVAENIEEKSADQNSALQELNHPAFAITTHELGKDTRKLTPEELEDHFEESNLQLLLEKHGERSKQVATRQAVKLKTEKRVLRPQSEPLKVNRWLPEETIILILEMHASQAKGLSFEVDFSNRQKIGIKSEDDLIIKIWTLELVLNQLEFNKEDFRNAIQSLLSRVKSMESLELSTGKDLIWGLEECIDSLALNCHITRLPGYEPQKTATRSKITKDVYQKEVFTDLGKVL